MARLFPHGNWNFARPAEVRDALRGGFAAWGLPGRMRVDNGHPWGSWSDLPRQLALWLIGLGVEVTWNRPRHPEENGTVGRDQGVTKQWVEPGTCAGAAELGARLEWAAQIQRACYPAVGGRSRLEAHPALATPARPYDPAREDELWELGRVLRFLGGGLWRRRVCATGQISLDNRRYGVGRRHAGQEVSVRFDPEAVQWVVLDARGVELARHAAEQITRERVSGLDVLRRKPSGPGAKTSAGGRT